MEKDEVKALFETKFLNVYDLQYEKGKHYYNASRRKLEDLVAVKDTEAFLKMLPDAISCVVVLNINGDERLLLTYEYRYPAGKYLLSVPAGLIDQEDINSSDPLIQTAIREIKEETNIDVKDTDLVKVINPLLFSTPGMSDESNGIVYAYITLDSLGQLNQDGAVGSEKFNGFALVTKEEARQILKEGKDIYGIYYSVYTWIALATFVGDLYEL